jgi:DNA-binding NarL/FixJ family response regulator
MTRRTLLLEDHPNTQTWISDIIREAFPDTEIEIAGTVQQGLALLEGDPYDQAIIDLSLPDGSGVDVIRAIAECHPTTRIVVATIFDDEDHLFAALRAGAKGYVLKDQPRANLVRVLKAMDHGEPPLSPSVARRILDFFERPPLGRPTSDEASLPEPDLLTVRESEVLEIIARGASKADVANSLKISPNTVATHIKSIYRKLDISSRAEASLAARRLGLLND